MYKKQYMVIFIGYHKRGQVMASNFISYFYIFWYTTTGKEKKRKRRHRVFRLKNGRLTNQNFSKRWKRRRPLVSFGGNHEDIAVKPPELTIQSQNWPFSESPAAVTPTEFDVPEAHSQNVQRRQKCSLLFWKKFPVKIIIYMSRSIDAFVAPKQYTHLSDFRRTKTLCLHQRTHRLWP